MDSMHRALISLRVIYFYDWRAWAERQNKVKGEREMEAISDAEYDA